MVLLQQVPDSITPTIIEITPEATRPLTMIDVTVAAFGLTGVIMGAAILAGLLAGAIFIWYRSRRPVSTVEARGGEHNLFRA